MRNSRQLRFFNNYIIAGLAAVLVFGLTACLSTAPAPKLVSIAVAPSSPTSLAVGSMVQFTATGTYADGSTADITNNAAWACDNKRFLSMHGGLPPAQRQEMLKLPRLYPV